MKNKCPLTPPGTNDKCPLQPAKAAAGQPGSIVVTRTEKRSWITLAITGFGALLLRYLRTVHERAFRAQPASKRKRVRA